MADSRMSFAFRFSFVHVLVFFACIAGRAAEDIVGCGGFLKSQFPVHFSKVFIKLYTKQGTLKESSDCAPTNGYYFIPIYDKGDYTLKLEAPPGWHFEPETVPLTFDGVNDPCSKGSDINFQFKGFAIKGQVVSRGKAEGPENILVNLMSEKDRTVKEKIKTREGGAFEFGAVEPGNYVIRAEAETLSFDKDSTKIVVRDGNVDVPRDAIVVAGYDVVGEVSFSGEPMKGVNFLLYGNDEKSNAATVPGCSRAPLPELREQNFICHVISDDRGRFKMSPVPPGNYRIRPHYVKFDVQPKAMNVEVKHSHVNLAEKFLVKGFSVSGRVMTSPGGKGIGNAEVHLNGELVTLTDKEGLYNLDSMEPGSYVLQVHSEALRFPEATVQLSPNKPEIEAVYPSEFRVCGLVTPSSGQSVRFVDMRRKDVDEDVAVEAAVNRETGAFCHFLPPGTWLVSVKVSDFEKSRGIQFLPASREIVVKSAPVNEIEFSQLRGKVIGNIVRLPTGDSSRGGDLTVKLKSQGSVVALKFLSKTESSYAFTDVMPGYYDVEVQSNHLCFESHAHGVSVTSSETIVPHFVQSGFKVKIVSSHETTARLRPSHARDKSEDIRLEKGENTICLPNATNYEVEPFGCHGYDKDFYVCNAKKDDAMKLTAITHEVTGFVTSSSSVNDLYVNVSHAGGQVKRIGPLKSVEENGSRKYKFSYKTKENQVLSFTPVSENILFQPESVEYRTRDDCAENVVQFVGEKGLIVEGGIEPPLSNVKITLRVRDGGGNDTGIELVTKADGKYKFGPLKNSIKYELTASKDSYVFTGPDKNGVFSAHKLAEINVVVLDNSTKEPLQGVLLSLTGGEKYRKNSMTGEDGALSFHSLSPGEYFLRPMMKEYKFEPSSQIIQVREGVAEKIELKGRRVSFSAYGVITSLNGEGESSVLIEAAGIDACSNLQEETLSEGNGHFRIRGLLPHCEYHIRLKTDSPVNAHIHRITPTDLVVKTNKGDVRDIKLIAFQLIEHMDLSVHVESTMPEHLKTLRLKLCKEEAPDSPVHTVKLDTLAGGVKHWGNNAVQERFLRGGLLVQLPFVLRDKTPYFIQLDSTLNKHTFAYKEPVVHFVADKTYRNFKFVFEPVPKALDHEFSNSNYFVVPLLAFLALLYTYSSRAVTAVQGFFGMFNSQKAFAAPASAERAPFPESAISDVSIEPVAVAATKARKTKARKT